MGTQFFWFYDVLIIAIFLGVTFRCFKKGFVSSLIGLVAVIAAFAGAVFLSGGLATFTYDNIIKNQIHNYIEENIEQISGGSALLNLSDLDVNAIKINNVLISDVNVTPDNAGKITLDLGNVDLSDIGIDVNDLDFFGLPRDNLTNINAGKANITAVELQQSEFPTLVLSKILANTIQNSPVYEGVTQTAHSVGNMLPQISNNFGNNISNSISGIFTAVIESNSQNITAAILDNIITPVIMAPLRTIIFFIIFFTITIVLSFAARSLSVINRFPVIGPVNSFLGGVVGALEAAVVILIVCITLNIIITITGNTIIFLNTMTISESVVFKHIYYLDFINFAL